MGKNWTGSESLSEDDPEVWQLIKEEKERQTIGLELIAAENICSRAALEAVGSCLSNKLSSGYLGSRSYGGTEVVDKIEILCQQRALNLFHLKECEWGVNVQCYSGSVANTSVYTALLNHGDKIMGLHLLEGGHFSHGFKSEDGKGCAAAANCFQSIPYRLDLDTGFVDYDNLLKLLAIAHKPKIIIAGTSTHSRLMDYKKFREICDTVGANLMADMAHVCGMVAAGVIPSPFEYADIVTTTTHKSLRGVQGALIFYRKGSRKCPTFGNITNYDFEEKINMAVFPGHQGAPHNNSIAGIAVTLRQASEPHFQLYQEQVIKNCKAMASKLVKLGYTLASGGTDNHLVVIDVRNKNVDGSTVELVCNKVKLVVTYVPNGIRLGTPALTSRGLMEPDFERIVDFVDQAVKIAAEVKQIQENNKSENLDVEFLLQKVANRTLQKMENLRNEIELFAAKFPLPGLMDL